MLGKVSRFAPVARNFDVGKPLATESKWLDAGRYEVVIEDSDASKAEDTGKIALVFRTDDGKLHRDNVYVMARDGHSFGQIMRYLLGATLPDAEAQKSFADMLTTTVTAARVLECFRGMRVVLVLRDGPGYRIEFDQENQGYLAFDAETKEAIGGGHTIEDAKRHMGNRQRSFRRIEAIEVVDEDNKQINLNAFNSVIASIKKSAAPEGDPVANQFAGYQGAATRK